MTEVAKVTDEDLLKVSDYSSAASLTSHAPTLLEYSPYSKESLYTYIEDMELDVA